MTRTLNNRGRPRRQSGQSMVEYAVICFFMAVCLFATPVGRQLSKAIHDFYFYLTFFISLP